MPFQSPMDAFPRGLGLRWRKKNVSRSMISSNVFDIKMMTNESGNSNPNNTTAVNWRMICLDYFNVMLNGRVEIIRLIRNFEKNLHFDHLIDSAVWIRDPFLCLFDALVYRFELLFESDN